MLKGLYTVAFTLALPVLLMRIAWRGRTHRARWYERLGFYPGTAAKCQERPIWVHAVSVGESMAAFPLIRALQQERDDLAIVVTTTTVTGAANVQRTLGDSVLHVYFPYDLPFILRRFIETFRPRILVILETELWPNTVAVCKQRGIKLVLANARLSQASLRGYAALAPLSRSMVSSFDCIAAQGGRDGERFLELGARPGRLEVTGSLKFDLVPPASLREQAEVLQRTLGVNRPVFMLGSTRDGEERILFDAVDELIAEFHDLLVVLAPRHPERFEEVTTLCAEHGYQVVRYSSGEPCSAETRIYLVDVMGELPRFYAAADIAFVGGSLLPFGGHNVLEPASLGIPVLCGPHTHNFAEICGLLRDAGALTVVPDVASLVAAARRWLADSNERDRVGQLGRETVRQHRGATTRTLTLIRRYLPQRTS